MHIWEFGIYSAIYLDEPRDLYNYGVETFQKLVNDISRPDAGFK